MRDALRLEGSIANHDGEFVGAVEIDTATGLIADVGPATGESDLDLRGCIVFPGFGDLHIHAREDVGGSQTYKEDFVSASDCGGAGRCDARCGHAEQSHRAGG